MIRRRALLAGAATLAAATRTARADRGLLLIVGAKPGSASDEIARAFAPFLERHLPPTHVEVRNVPGEAGLVAYRAVAEVEAAGSTVGWAVTPSLPARMVDRRGGALMSRLRLLGAVQREPVALVAPAEGAPQSMREALRRAAIDADALPLGTPSAGSPPHLAALLLQEAIGTRLNIVSFPSAAAAREAVLAGNVGAAALGLSDAVASLRQDRMIGLAVADQERSHLFPEVPTLRESGFDLTADILRGLAAPAALPDSAAGRLIGAMHDVTADPEFAAEADSDGFTVVWVDGEAWSAVAAAERRQLARLWQASPWLPASNT